MEHYRCLSILAAYSVIKALELNEIRDLSLKWPNDVYVCDRKLAGILCETCRIEDGRISGIAAGIGINVNLSADDLAAVPLPATSLAVEAGRSFELEKMVAEFAFFLKQYYIIYSRLYGCTIT